MIRDKKESVVLSVRLALDHYHRLLMTIGPDESQSAFLKRIIRVYESNTGAINDNNRNCSKVC
jgi:hypothetical protein